MTRRMIDSRESRTGVEDAGQMNDAIAQSVLHNQGTAVGTRPERNAVYLVNRGRRWTANINGSKPAADGWSRQDRGACRSCLCDARRGERDAIWFELWDNVMSGMSLDIYENTRKHTHTRAYTHAHTRLHTLTAQTHWGPYTHTHTKNN